jgi:hypothetical protein
VHRLCAQGVEIIEVSREMVLRLLCSRFSLCLSRFDLMCTGYVFKLSESSKLQRRCCSIRRFASCLSCSDRASFPARDRCLLPSLLEIDDSDEVKMVVEESVSYHETAGRIA